MSIPDKTHEGGNEVWQRAALRKRSMAQRGTFLGIDSFTWTVRLRRAVICALFSEREYT